MIILRLYITLLGPVIAGIVNSIFCKLNILNCLKVPIDFNKKFKDKKRIFGDHKTWKGFMGYLIFNILVSIILGFIWKLSKLEHLNYFYINHDNTIIYNILIGFLLGLSYALFELPNSFIKRRLDIEPGKTIDGAKKVFFIIFDQADSVFGVALIVWLFYPIGIWIYLLFIVVGTITHLLINILLYFLHLRKNMF
jgi:CDP-diglyceride synthetase